MKNFHQTYLFTYFLHIFVHIGSIIAPTPVSIWDSFFTDMNYKSINYFKHE